MFEFIGRELEFEPLAIELVPFPGVRLVALGGTLGFAVASEFVT